MSNRTIAILGIVILLLLSTQVIFSPLVRPKHTKYVDANAESKKGSGSKSKPFKDLQYAIDKCEDGDTLFILPGEYKAVPRNFLEDLCGNAEIHATQVNATRGFLIEGKQLVIVGAGANEVKLITGAGYGVLFLNSHGSALTGVTVTGGIRDPDGNATDAGVVAKFSSVTITNCEIVDNTHQLDSVVVSIGGIIGREGSCLVITGNKIVNNGWDGIALYRGAEAYISDNTIKKGRGAGIGITWDAAALITGNQVSEYWKGIGSFGDSRVIARNNLVSDCLGWGIIANGSSCLDAVNNVVYHNGNCGLASWGENTSGRFANNIVVLNGWKEEWVAPGVGFQNFGGYENFQISCNNIWANEAGSFGGMPDLTGIDGNISVDPMFVNPSIGDFRLKLDSPCLKSGNPAISHPNGGRSDIGLYPGLREW